MSARIEVAYCITCRGTLSRISGLPWRHNVEPEQPHAAVADRASIRDLMQLRSQR